MKNFKRLFLAASLSASLTIAAVLTGPGCKSTLEPGGVYAPGVTSSVTNADNTVSQIFTPTQRPDMELFATDVAFGIAYDSFDLVLQLERGNRAWLYKQSPEIKHTLDQVRPESADAVRKYTAARKVYIANPTPAGLTELQNILAEAQRIATSVQAVVPSVKK